MLSKIATLFCCFVLLYSTFVFYPKWKQVGSPEAAIGWDVSGYYWYLPHLFIYHDLKNQNSNDSIINKYHPTPSLDQAFKFENANYVMKYASGMAICYSPAFFIAHKLAPYFNFEQDGFTKPYQLSLQIWSVLIACLGLLFYRKFLSLYFSDKITALCLILLVIGTNYWNYASFEAAQTHSYLFTLYAALLLTTHNFYLKTKKSTAVLIGIIVGLETLIRPTEIISCLIPLLWGLEKTTVKEIETKFAFLKSQFPKLLAAVIIALLIISIQLFYWKYASGHWVVYSYQSQGFSFLHPHFFDFTFSARSGWLRYCPMLLLAFVGIPLYYKKGTNKVMVFVFFGIAYYIVSSWDIWWFTGRAMIQYYPVLFLIIAQILKFVANKNWEKIFLYLFLIVFSYLNIWLTIQAHPISILPNSPAYRGGLYDYDGMTRQYYNRVIGRWNLPPEVNKLKDIHHIYEGTPIEENVLYFNSFQTNNQPYFKVDTNEKYSTSIAVKINQPTKQWLRVAADFLLPQKEWNIWTSHKFVVRLFKNSTPITAEELFIDRLIEENKIQNLSIDFKLKKSELADSIVVFFTNEGNKKILYMKNLKITSFN